MRTLRLTSAHGDDECNFLGVKPKCLLQSLLRWYNGDAERIEFIRTVFSRRNNMSLRVIDWLVTNYSRSVSVTVCDKSPGSIPRDLFKDYHKKLDAHKKERFDPFARGLRIEVRFHEGSEGGADGGSEDDVGDVRETTVGQLNFFKWYFERNLASFLDEHRDEVEAHMKSAEASRRRPCSAKQSTEAHAVHEVHKVHKVHKVNPIHSRPVVFCGPFVMSFP
jgi:hypothetical protein